MNEYETKLASMSETEIQVELIGVLRRIKKGLEAGLNCDRARYCRRELKRRGVKPELAA